MDARQCGHGVRGGDAVAASLRRLQGLHGRPLGGGEVAKGEEEGGQHDGGVWKGHRDGGRGGVPLGAVAALPPWLLLLPRGRLALHVGRGVALAQQRDLVHDGGSGGGVGEGGGGGDEGGPALAQCVVKVGVHAG